MTHSKQRHSDCSQVEKKGWPAFVSALERPPLLTLFGTVGSQQRDEVMSTPRTPRERISLRCRNPDCRADQKAVGKIAQWRPSPHAIADKEAVDAQYPNGNLSADGRYDHSMYCPKCATVPSPWQHKYLRAAQSGREQGMHMLALPVETCCVFASRCFVFIVQTGVIINENVFVECQSIVWYRQCDSTIFSCSL